MKKKDFESIYSNYKKKVFMIAYSITLNYDDAMDIVQETFLRIYKNYENIENLTSYILITCKNLSLNFIKKHSRIIYDNRILDITIDNSQNDNNKNKEKLNNIKIFLDHLSINERKVFSLKFYGNFSYTEIAKELDVKEVTIRTFYKRAIDKMKEYFNV